MAGISVQQEIAAPARRVWSIFSDITRYERWNPFIVKAVGALRYNTTLDMTIVTPNGTRVEFSPHVIEVTRGQRVAWTTGLRIPGLFARVVIFEIESTDES